LQLAEFFEKQPASARHSDELPWLLCQTESFVRLRTCLLDIDHFVEIYERDKNELLRYWVRLGEERTMGKGYLDAFRGWSDKLDSKEKGFSGYVKLLWRRFFRRRRNAARLSSAASQLASFLNAAALHAEAESLMRQALSIDERRFRSRHPDVAVDLDNLAGL